jgi:TRAP transporter TAXI family solute receptor
MIQSKNPSDLPIEASTGKFSITRPNVMTMITESFGLSRAVSVALIVFSCLVFIGAVFFFVHSAPPSTLTITSGPEGSIFYTNAVKYSNLLKRQGVQLNILTSEGSLENLQRLDDPSFKVDVGFVQGGLTNGTMDKLISLGSISYQPLLVFYRGAPIESLADLAGKRLAIGPVGSGTRTLVLTLLGANGIKPGESTTLLDWESQEGAKALLDGTVDAVFLMGEDASAAIMHKLLMATDIHLLNFAQAEAYTRRFSYLSVLKLPQGAIDLGRNIPSHDVYLIGPTVELIARNDLHPALSDLLLEAARDVHGKAALFQHKDEFPAQIQHDIPLSADAARFYRSGTGFFYRHLPFWLASLTSRIVVVFIPMLVILIPILRTIPHLYRWQNQSRIYRWYRALLILENELFHETDAAKRQHLLKRLDGIQKEVHKMKVPAFLADQFYGLRGHIDFVRQMMNNNPPH